MDHFQQRLFQRINYERQLQDGTQHFKLQTMRELLSRLSQPHLKYPVIHVAGTKGKGSVSTMVAGILSSTGRNVGIYTSPHLESVHQRIAIDGQAIGNDELETVLAEVFQVVDELDQELASLNPCLASSASGTVHDPGLLPVPDSEQTAVHPSLRPPTFFEIITAAAMHHFSRRSCDAVVLEVGLGGRLDSTNVCHPDVCVITNISLDHTRQLGNSLDQIAAEKAGIIKPGIPVVSGATHPLAADVIERTAVQRGCRLYQLERDFRPVINRPDRFGYRGTMISSMNIDGLSLRMPGHHQVLNATIATAVCQVLNEQGWNIGNDAIASGLEQASLPGRTEVIRRQPTIVLDIAHNVASIEALVHTLRDELGPRQGDRERVLVFGTSTDKRYREMLALLLPEFDRVLLTRYRLNPRGRDPGSLLRAAHELILEHDLKTRVEACDTPRQAWDRALGALSTQDLLCLAGSAFLIAEMRPTAIQHRFTDDRSQR